MTPIIICYTTVAEQEGWDGDFIGWYVDISRYFAYSCLNSSRSTQIIPISGIRTPVPVERCIAATTHQPLRYRTYEACSNFQRNPLIMNLRQAQAHRVQASFPELGWQLLCCPAIVQYSFEEENVTYFILNVYAFTQRMNLKGLSIHGRFSTLETLDSGRSSSIVRWIVGV